jgi:hypothetical protein
MPKRYYFHLVSDTEYLRDPDGVEANSLDQAHREGLRALQDLRDEGDIADWSGWTLEATDEAGHVLFLIPLDQTNFVH